MEVIVCHTNADFDALGSLVAAKLLRPRAMACFPGHINKKVKELYSLYKDSLNLTLLEHINVQEVTHLIVVDTQSADRIGKLKPLFLRSDVKLTIIDHHPKQALLPEWATVRIEAVGATTTLLVEEIRARKMSLTPSIATVLATAIYSDTACLTAGYTTARDAEAVAFLLAEKANLEVVASYTRSPLSDGQRSLFEELLASSRDIAVKDAKIKLTTCEVNEYVDGLAVLTGKLAEIDDCDACIAVVNMDGRVHVVGRSKSNRIDMHKLMQRFGGSGHAQAASATLKDASRAELAQIEQYLEEIVEPPLRVRDIMSSPVRSVTPDTTMAEAGQLMLRCGHSGLPVTEGGRLVGIISRRDLDKANHHGLENAPVKGFMSSQVVVVSANASLEEVQRMLITKDIGRLPVVDENGGVIGIVTRTDVLRTLHGKSYPHWYQANYRSRPDQETLGDENATAALEAHIGRRTMGLLLLIGQEADRQSARAYLVGGLVRDIFIGHENADVDVVVEPLAIPLAQRIAKLLGASCVEYPKFGTATVTLPHGETIDFVTARTEFYAMPAALPDVENASIRQDLYRRDFTINTLAVVLNQGQFGRLLDFFGGRDDLTQGLVRVLYNLSFVEDPTRIIRAIRFEQRYGFRIEEQTERFLRNALENGVLEKVSREKLRDELQLMLSEPAAARSILRMDELGVWPHILPNFLLSDNQIKTMRRIAQTMRDFGLENEGKPSLIFDQFAVFTAVILMYKPFSDWPPLIESLKLPRKARDVCLEVALHMEAVSAAFHASKASLPDIWLMMEELSVEAQLIIASLLGQEIFRELRALHAKVTERPMVSGQDLIQRGVTPGPLMGRILAELKKARLAGLIPTQEAELLLLDALLERGLKGGN
ncbi:MAG: CBS domain-containing protein [Selenomonadales bacterium]|nr:CBS domain-containing protein [Selenomonadales bacterium]